MQSANPHIRLDEVTLMRTILALLIVFTHAFTCYNGSWNPPEGYVDIALYKWFARVSFAFTLEAFVFISGYLFAFQRITLNRSLGIVPLIISKLKRLIIPSVVFSVLYFILFERYAGLKEMVYSILNGCGHMWFLPMLFWCFFGGWLLERVKVKDRWKLLFLIVLNLFCLVSLPLRVSNAATYMVYFYGGFLFYKYSDKIKSAITPNKLVWSWIIFIVVFAMLRPLSDLLVTNDNQTLIEKLFVIVGNKTGRLIYASLGLLAFYWTAVYYIQHHRLKPITVKIAACCFGIYLFQQFVLQLLYYKCSFPLLVGPYWLPWCGFVIAAVVSYALSDLLLRTKSGKFLIG